MKPTKCNLMRNAFGSFLAGVGFANFICVIFLEFWWTDTGPKIPDPILGYVFLHRFKGFVGYFSAFEITATNLLVLASIPLCFVGRFIAPNRWDIAPNGIIQKYPKLVHDDPTKIYRWGLPLGFIASPLVLYFVGPSFVTRVNGFGTFCNGWIRCGS